MISGQNIVFGQLNTFLILSNPITKLQVLYLDISNALKYI